MEAPTLVPEGAGVQEPVITVLLCHLLGMEVLAPDRYPGATSWLGNVSAQRLAPAPLLSELVEPNLQHWLSSAPLEPQSIRLHCLGLA